jgi:cell division protein FtsZ
LNEQAKDRISKLRSLSSNFTSRADDIKERLDTPAYLRKKVVLQNVQASNENNMSRYNLNDDNQILGNNRFLHDNVD